MKRIKRTKLEGVSAVYHAMSRVVGGEMLLGEREKEVLRKMLWQVADFCGVEILTYCVMTNHFHVLVRVPEKKGLSDAELLRRFKVLYPKPTKYQTAEFARLEQSLKLGDADAEAIRQRLLARMSDLSEFMKTVKQRFSIWYNRNHGNRKGTLWMDRFKSVLVEGQGNPLQTMAAYIDLNSVRAGLVEDPKDYRFCGYAEAVAGVKLAKYGLRAIWAAYADGSLRGRSSMPDALRMHRELIFGKRAADPGLSEMKRSKALKVLEGENGQLPKSAILRCRVRYFTDGAILGSAEFVRGFVGAWQMESGRKHLPKVNDMRGTNWGDLAVIQGLRSNVFG
ncbi:MAG TPA: transposase [Opitutae bacterium]|nr:transposase [Opitutae bacterium]